jgi:hypothetical protein
MRKTLLLPLALLLVVAISAPPVGAFEFQQGDNRAKMTDFASFFTEYTTAHPGPDPLPLAEPTPGTNTDEYEDLVVLSHTLGYLTNLYQPTFGVGAEYWSPGGQGVDLIALIYDLKIDEVRSLGSQVYEIDLVSAGRMSVAGSVYTGGRFDLWAVPTGTFTEAGSGGYPWDWSMVDTSGFAANWDTNPFGAGEYDTFPTGNTQATAAPVLSGTFVPPENGAPLLMLTLDYSDGSGGSSPPTAYINVTHNYTSTPLDPIYLGGLAHISLKNTFTFYPDDVVPLEPSFDNPNTDPVYWATASEDPLLFTVLPEPGSLALLGLALAGMGVARRRKKG